MVDSRVAFPFLNWAGGKNRSILNLLEFLPESFDTYWEPFLGAGAMYFAINPVHAHISDINLELMNCYQHIRDTPELVSNYLEYHKNHHSKTYFYSTRNTYNLSPLSAEKAATFIYLNKACFNGIFRVNKLGNFNVPFGGKSNPSFPTSIHLQFISKILKKAEIHVGSFLDVFEKYKPKDGDFIYIDPPYPPLNGTSNFRHYTPDKFSIDDHKLVAEIGNELSSIGCKVLISNADLESIRTIYRNWSISILPVTRWVAANGKRYKVNELVIMNYKK